MNIYLWDIMGISFGNWIVFICWGALVYSVLTLFEFDKSNRCLPEKCVLRIASMSGVPALDCNSLNSTLQECWCIATCTSTSLNTLAPHPFHTSQGKSQSASNGYFIGLHFLRGVLIAHFLSRPWLILLLLLQFRYSIFSSIPNLLGGHPKDTSWP